MEKTLQPLSPSMYESRVTSITRSGVTTNSNSYNGLDTRYSTTDSAGTKTFKRAGAGVLAPVLGDGSAVYTPGISERRSSTTTYSHPGIKSGEAQSSTSQSIGATRQYDAFGNLDSSTGTWKGPFGYGGPFGYQETGDHGLRLLGHRYYDSSTGRFLTRDNAKQGRNWYAYCGNDPVSFADPDGMAGGKVWLLELIIGNGKKIRYWIVEGTEAEADDFAKWIDDSGKIKHHHGHPAGDPAPGPNHRHNAKFHDEHVTTADEADEAGKRGSPGWADWRSVAEDLGPFAIAIFLPWTMVIELTIEAGPAFGDLIDPYVQSAAQGYYNLRITRWLGD